jgi:hypothetical protein
VPGANTPGALTEPAMCFNIALNRTVMFGGVEQLASTSVDTTWLFDGTSWVAAPITGPKPPVRTFGKMVYNLQRGTCVLVGGMNPFTGVALNDAWEFNGSTWTQLPGTAPAVRAFGLAYDIVRANVVHFGGLNASSQVSNQTSLFGAQATTYGAGCVGSNGVPTLLPVDQPRIGANWQLVMNNNNAVSPIAIIVVGASSTAPIPLDAIGMLGCAGFVTPDLLLTTGSSAGVAPWSTTIPNDPAVVSAHLYIQGISFDPGINPAWLVSSNAVDGLVGY